MAKKKNIYSSNDTAVIKAELDSVVDYLEGLDVHNMTDDIDWKVTQKGGIAPVIVCRIEEAFKTALGTIKECCQLLLALHEKEGFTPYIESKDHAIRSKMEQIQEYYRQRPVNSISHRKITHQYTQKGQTKTIQFIAATQHQQITDRTMITRRIMEILPLLEKLQELGEMLEVKGDYDIPESFLLRGLA